MINEGKARSRERIEKGTDEKKTNEIDERLKMKIEKK